MPNCAAAAIAVTMLISSELRFRSIGSVSWSRQIVLSTGQSIERLQVLSKQ
ncbi:hypothetical protein AAEH90_19260 [Shewanella algae]|uniref:hypothetical protein n=1 Tax=Shewanella algae TaxID=38313 RepID=UPI001C56E87B|nr:hypothetical protein [Shewanella algae]